MLERFSPAEVQLEIYRVEAAEVDQRWSFVGSNTQPRWLWHAIDHQTGLVLAYAFGRRKDEVFLELQQLLEPFGIGCFYTAYWGAYQRHLEAEEHCPGRAILKR